MKTRSCEPLTTEWQSRLREMEGWYRDFSADMRSAADNLLYDYAPYAPVLSRFEGAVLDVGGGAGISGAFLPIHCDYVVLEPSMTWLDGNWDAIAHLINPIRVRPRMVLGMGERLPFQPQVFDFAMAMWSLNHAAEPAAVLEEMFRVMKPGGRALVVLEDAEPSVRDLLGYYLRAIRHRVGRASNFAIRPRKPYGLLPLLGRKLLRRPWPVQSDHIPITELQFRSWIKDRLVVTRRSWDGGFLSFELQRVVSMHVADA